MWRHLFSRSPLPADGVRLTLPDGTPMLARPIRPDDAPRFVAGYEKLSERSRRLRFFGQVSSLSSRQLDFLTAPDGRNHIAWGAMRGDAPDAPGAGMAVARCIRLDTDSAIAEVAMTVLDEWQGRGVGLRLHACLHLQAQAAGIRQFLYDVSCENEGFIRHLQALGAQTVSRDRDLVRLMLPVLGGPRAVTAKTPSARALRAVLQDLTQPTPAAR